MVVHHELYLPEQQDLPILASGWPTLKASNPTADKPTANGHKAHDILQTIFLLQSRFRLSVPHIISSILDHAEYWVQTSSLRREKVNITGDTPIRLYLTSSAIDGVGLSPVRKVVFKIASHDQGWCSRRDGGNWTWVDVVADSPGRVPRNFERLYTNVLADRNARIWVIDMDRSEVQSSDPEARRRADWVGKLRSGDVISVIPKACFPGWVNNVYFAKVDVYTAWHL